MKCVSLIVLCAVLGAASALAGSTVEEEGPLSPCLPQDTTTSNGSSDHPSEPWGVEIAASFSKEEALDEFERAKKDYPEILGSYEPMVVATCDLHMGTQLRYSARIGLESREDAENLCNKLQAAGGACIVQKN
jgi:hypothetical protein